MLEGAAACGRLLVGGRRAGKGRRGKCRIEADDDKDGYRGYLHAVLRATSVDIGHDIDTSFPKY